MSKAVVTIVVGAASLGLVAPPAVAASPVDGFRKVGAALAAHGIQACETPDWSVTSKAQDDLPVSRDGVRAQRSRLVVLAPQLCPPVHPETGDVSPENAGLVGAIDVFDFKSATALKRHGEDYTEGRGYGYVRNRNVLIQLYAGSPPGVEEAFFAAMNDLRAEPKYVCKLC
jgi:hypothetical protein